MENCEFLRKSVLKKSNLSVIKKGKRVSFCSTVKVFIDELNADPRKDIVDLKLNCVEVNIVDKSSDDSVNCRDISKNDDCNATDFLVHKVVYENGIELESDVDTDALSEEADEHTILFETNTDDEGLQFVVHKVTDHEDDLIQQELDLECNDANPIGEEIECDSDIIGKLSELSIENILTHDKIIAFIDQNTLGLSSLLKSHIKTSENILPLAKSPSEDSVKTSAVSPCLKNSELVLSPPLQELSLDKIVKAQSGNVLCELDISPLNSIQETDSDSDASSEGTMIMMTTEESEKNEKHIRESFQKFESMKKEKVEIKDMGILSESEENILTLSEGGLESVHNSNSPTDITYKENLCDNSNMQHNIKDNSKEIIGSVYNNSSDKSETDRKSNSSLILCSLVPPCDKDPNVSVINEAKKTSFTPINNSYYWDKSLASVQIPKDVREWKIISSPEKCAKSESRTANPNSSTLHGDEYLSVNRNSSNMHKMQEATPKSDELENFVLASKERVQRIRKRYLDKAERKAGSSPVRGIRPRFGSTAEILQLVQKQNQHPLITFGNRSHVSWPCNDTVSNSEINIQSRRQLNHMFGCQSLPTEYSLQSPFRSCVFEDSSSSNCDHDSVSSCPSIFFHERGVPEGASPPRSLSEDSSSIEQCSNEDNPSNIVYFSMKV